MVDSSKYYVFYDGDCGFCNYWVQFILQNDHKDQFLFSSLQSEFGQNFLRERGLEMADFNTLFLWKPGSYYLEKSHAAFQIAAVLGGKYRMLSYLKYLPKFITDPVYSMVAKNRQKLSSSKCFLPNQKEREKFVENLE